MRPRRRKMERALGARLEQMPCCGCFSPPQPWGEKFKCGCGIVLERQSDKWVIYGSEERRRDAALIADEIMRDYERMTDT